MDSNLLRLLKDSLIYGFGRYTQTIIGIILIPIYTRIFSPSEYGIVDLISITMGFMLIFLVFGLDSATAIYFYESKNIEDEIKVVSTSFIFRICFTTIITVGLILFSNFFSLLIFNTDIYSYYFAIGFLNLPFQLVVIFYLELLRLRIKPVSYSVLNILNVVLNLFSIILFVVFLNLGIIGIFYGYLFGNFIFTLLGYLLIKDYLRVKFVKSLLIKMLKFGVPLIPASISIWILTFSNRIILNLFTSEYDVGLFSIGNKIASIILLAVAAFQIAWAPFAFSIQHEPNAKEIYAKTLTLYSFLTLFLGLGLALFSKDVLYIMTTPEYIAGYQVVFILVLFYIFNGMAVITGIGIHLTKKTIIITLSTLTIAGLNIILNFLLIPRYGMIAAAIAMTISSLVNVTILLYFNQKYYFINFEIKKNLQLFLLYGLIIFINFSISFEDLFYSVFFKIILVLTFLILIAVLKIVNFSQIKNLIPLMIKKKSFVEKIKE